MTGHKSTTRCGAIVATGSLLLIAATPVPAAAAGGTAEVGTLAEAWHTTIPADADPCSDPVDCAQAPNSPVYPEHTLHVDLKAGQQTAATYLQLDTAKLPFDAQISGGTLRLPVDDQPSDGSVRPESAKLVACPVVEAVQEASGSPSTPPKTDCKLATAPAKYRKGKQPAFEVDVTTLATSWSGGNAAVAILPSPEAEKDRDSWHVAFWGKKNKNPEAAQITATLTYTASETAAVPPPSDLGLAPPAAPEPAAELALPKPPPAPAAKPPKGAAAPKQAPPPETAPQAAPAFRKVGYPYPVAWLMPLLLLIGFAMTGHALTKNLSRAAILRR